MDGARKFSPMEPETGPQDTLSSRVGLNRSLIWAAIIWTVLILIGAWSLIAHQLNDHREKRLQATAQRLENLADAVDLTFQQLEALPKALGRQASIADFLALCRDNAVAVVEGLALMPGGARPIGRWSNLLAAQAVFLLKRA